MKTKHASSKIAGVMITALLLAVVVVAFLSFIPQIEIALSNPLEQIIIPLTGGQ